MSCPNINTPEYQALVKQYGAGEAFAIWERGGEISDRLYGIGLGNTPEYHINTLNAVTRFLENIGIQEELVPEILDAQGGIVQGAIAAANFLTGKIQYKSSDSVEKRLEAWNKKPEEAAHFFFRLMQNNVPLKNALLMASYRALEAGKGSFSQEYLDAYKNKPGALMEEYIGQAIAEAIKRVETKNGSPEDYSFLQKFLNWIDEMFKKFSDYMRGEEQDSFEVAAMKILSSDTSDLMTWDEYNQINNKVNFADVVTDESVVKENVVNDVVDTSKDFNALITGQYRKKTRYLNKTLDKYYKIKTVTASNTGYPTIQLVPQNTITQKLSDTQQERLIKDNGYVNVVPALKGLPEILKKFKGQKIALSSKTLPIQVKKGEMKVYTDVLEMIGRENPDIKSISAEEFVNEVHNFLKLNYLLGFQDHRDVHPMYRVSQTFQYTPGLMGSPERQFTDEYLTNLTEDDIRGMTPEQRLQVSYELGLRGAPNAGTGNVFHRKISIRFNNEYFPSGHFNYQPAAWGNLTPFYSNSQTVKDAVLLHEIQNDWIEQLWNSKTQTNKEARDILNEHLNKMEDYYKEQASGGKVEYNNLIGYNMTERLMPIYDRGKIVKPESFVTNALIEFGNAVGVKERLNELLNLSVSAPSMENVKKGLDNSYRSRRQVQELIRHGGLNSVLSDALKDAIIVWLKMSVYDTTQPKELKREFSINFSQRINKELREWYGKNFEEVLAPTNMSANVPYNKRKTAINTSYNSFIAVTEKQMLQETNKQIKFAKTGLIRAIGNDRRNTLIKKLLALPNTQLQEIIDNVHYNEQLLEKMIKQRATAVQSKGISSAENMETLLEHEAFKAIAITEVEKEEYDKKVKEIRRTIDTNLNYVTPLMHHLIQTHIQDYSKNVPLIFSGYAITMLSQGNGITAELYAGPEEVKKGIVSKVGPMYTAISGWAKDNNVKLQYTEDVPGLKGKAGGYILDLSNYDYKEPILYGMESKKPLTSTIADWQSYEAPKNITEFSDIYRNISDKKQQLQAEGYMIRNLSDRGFQYLMPENNVQFQLSTTAGSTDSKLLVTLKDFVKRLGGQVRTVDQLVIEGKVYTGVAVTDILNRTIDVVEGKAGIDTLPEEVGHLFTALLPADSYLLEQMKEEARNSVLYDEVYDEYKDTELYKNPDGSVNEEYILNEVMGKLISKAILNEWSRGENKSAWNKFWDKLWKWIQQLVGSYREDQQKNPYDKAAQQILSGDVSALDIEGRNLAKERGQYYFQLNPKIVASVNERLKAATDVQRDVVKEVYLDVHDRIILDEDHIYKTLEEVNPTVFNSVTTRISGKKVFTKEDSEGNPIEDPYMQNREWGNDVDKLLQGVINGEDIEEISTGIIPDKVKNEVYWYFKGLINNLTSDGSIALTQVIVADFESKIAGSIDLLLVDPYGNMTIVDLKTSWHSIWGSVYANSDTGIGEGSVFEDKVIDKDGNIVSRPLKDGKPIKEPGDKSIKLPRKKYQSLQTGTYAKIIGLKGYPVQATRTEHILLSRDENDNITGWKPDNKGGTKPSTIVHALSENEDYIDVVVPTKYTGKDRLQELNDQYKTGNPLRRAVEDTTAPTDEQQEAIEQRTEDIVTTAKDWRDYLKSLRYRGTDVNVLAIQEVDELLRYMQEEMDKTEDYSKVYSAFLTNLEQNLDNVLSYLTN